jgi:hypothetical protein
MSKLARVGRSLLLVAGLSAVASQGCAPAEPDAGEIAGDEVRAADAWRVLVGHWEAVSPTGSIRAMDLHGSYTERGRRLFVRGASSEYSGWYSAGETTLSLWKGNAVESYWYARSGEQLTLTRAGVTQRFRRVSTSVETPCGATPNYAMALPTSFQPASWARSIASRAVIVQGEARHRGHDVFVREGEAQWAIAKFAYGAADADLKGEPVDMFVSRSGGAWESLGSSVTTDDGEHATVAGVADDGGRVFFELPAARRLGVGLHRVHFVVRGDRTVADAYIHVLPANARFAVTDVDGTITESENAQVLDVLLRRSPAAHPGAPEALRALSQRGYAIFYLTARPDWLRARTHEWLRERGFPEGVVHTTLSFTGAFNGPAQEFKSAELAAARAIFNRAPDFAFGNRASDVAAYSSVSVAAGRAYYYRFDGDVGTGVHHDDYRTLVDGLAAAPAACALR